MNPPLPVNALTNHEGLRYNEGKVRYDLLHPFAKEQLAKVFTMGAKKYAENNWQKGMPWSKVLASLHRHLEAIERGEDYDIESGLLHAAHVEWNAHALCAYYKIYPQGDDRQHSYLKDKRIGLDIDDVLADWCPAFAKYFKMEPPTSWAFGFPELIKKAIEIEGLDYAKFLSELPVKTPPTDLRFEPTVYITARAHTPQSVAANWIKDNGFPQVPVVQVKSSTEKLQVAKDYNLDIFVDDKFETFVDFNKNGILCYLFNTPHNQRYNVGHKRLYSLKEL